MHLIHRSNIGLIALLSAGLALGCSSDSKNTSNPDGGGGTSSGGGGASSGGGGATGGGGGATGGTSAGDGGVSPCDVTLAPSADDLTTVQTALDNQVKSGNTVCFSKGTYKFQNHITLSAAQNVTFRGTGSTMDDVLFDFSTQTTGKEGVLVTTDGFTVTNLSIKNTSGNGITVQANNSHFDGIKVYWDAPGTGTNGPDGGTKSGAYAIYPVQAVNTVIENSEVYGASDAGIYTGQCQGVVVRNNKSHDNVLGIEIENTIGADVHDNEVYDNTTGFLLDLLPDLSQKIAKDYHVHDNNVHDNNHANFAEGGTLAATAPQGTGVLVLASSNVEIDKNKIVNEGGVGVLIVSFDIIDILTVANGGTPSTPDANTNRFPDHVYVHDNTFAGNGTDPQGAYAVFQVTDAGKGTVPYDVLWDGILDPAGYGDAGTSSTEAAKICLGTTEQGTFINFHGDTSLGVAAGYTTDSPVHQCTLDIPTLSP